VEDSPALLKLARTVLEAKGYRVLSASTGEEALAISRDNATSIDLLLTDLVLPGMSGGAMAEQIVSAHGHMRVLYMSGYTGDETTRHGIQTAQVAFLQKPFTPGVLTKKVREVLDRV
jgi:two-component system, cell cycle sensor histidine kinase and response regulator CckA